MVMVLGALITLLGGTGIFAVFNDRATVDNNTATSGSRPKAADVRIDTASLDPTSGSVNCDSTTWDKDNLTTGLYNATDVQPGSDLGTTYLCLKNVGSGTLSLTASVIDLQDLDVACTGDEAASGDTTCGPDVNQSPQAGELSPLIKVGMWRVDCPTGLAYVSYDPQALDNLTDWDFGGLSPILPDEIACVKIQVTYPAPATELQAQLAQSDEVLWRFAFDVVAS
jgi:predicted ribosomally synthesized peptide with SipW-like signal peptide